MNPPLMPRIAFDPLSPLTMASIVDKFLTELQAQLEDKRVLLEVSESARGWLAERGYRASYTTPVFHGEQLAAFLFFDSKEPGTFSVETGQFMDTFADLIAQLFLLQRQVVDGMLGTIKVAVGLARIRDLETG